VAGQEHGRTGASAVFAILGGQALLESWVLSLNMSAMPRLRRCAARGRNAHELAPRVGRPVALDRSRFL